LQSTALQVAVIASAGNQVLDRNHGRPHFQARNGVNINGHVWFA